MKTKVLQRLKPKTASLGFSQTELDGVAESISGNLTDESTEEQIESAIDAILPFLKVSQSLATRVINAKKEELEKQYNKKEPDKGSPDKDDKGEPEWFKSYREKTEKEIADLKFVGVAKSRKDLFEATLEGLPEKQKLSKLRDFDRIQFKDDADFTGYLEEQKEVVKDIKQELSESGLESIEIPGSGRQVKEEEAFIKQMQELNKEK